MAGGRRVKPGRDDQIRFFSVRMREYEAFRLARGIAPERACSSTASNAACEVDSEPVTSSRSTPTVALRTASTIGVVPLTAAAEVSESVTVTPWKPRSPRSRVAAIACDQAAALVE